jgi:ribosomal-protein-alanine N-acetyltransferase
VHKTLRCENILSADVNEISMRMALPGGKDFMIFDSVIETERFILRCKDFCDAGHLFRLRSGVEYTELFGRERYTKIEQAHDFIRKIRDDKFSYTFSIVPKGFDEAVGSVCLWNIDYNTKTAEIGYALEKGYRGKGYAYEACEMVIRYGFDQLRMKTITAFPRVVNLPSVGLARKLGFQCLGTVTMTMESGEETENYNFRLNLIFKLH